MLAATSALIHGFGGGRQHRAEAEQRDVIRGRWGKSMTLGELIEHEAAERGRLAEIFGWLSRRAERP